MAKLNLACSVVFLLLSVLAIRGTETLGLGTLSDPGAGLYPFGISILLGIFSLVLVIQSLIGIFLKKNQENQEGSEIVCFSEGLQDADFGFEKNKVKRVGMASLLLLAGAFLLETAGFILCAFLLVFILIRVMEKESMLFSTTVALCSSVLPYVLFKTVVGMQLPQGILKIF